MRSIAVIGLGYVGLPLAVALGRKKHVVHGFDTDGERIAAVRRGSDSTGMFPPETLAEAAVRWTSAPEDLVSADLYIVTVPTPIDAHRRPDLSALEAASRTVGSALRPGDIVVFESTVYPGVTEDFCGPILERVSGLVAGVDFHLGYSPERINPGDGEHTLETVKKIVAGDDGATAEILAEVYGSVVEAGVYVASSIQVAEAAKVIENVQRDLNIALMNELAIIFDRLGLDTTEVLNAAATKWNFHRYHPGLVGGHCIGVDPYYLTAKAESVGIHPQVILAGRRINDGMSAFVAGKTVKLLIRERRRVDGARVAVLGIAFKAEVADTRNSRVPDIVKELVDYGTDVLVHDPCVSAEKVVDEYGLELVGREALTDLDAVVLATPHAALIDVAYALAAQGTPVVVDVLSALESERIDSRATYWRL